MRLGFGFSRHCRRAYGLLTAGAVCGALATGFSVSDASAQAALVDGPRSGETVVQKSVAVGPAVIVRPKYEGSQEHEAIPIPIIIPKLVEEEDTPDGVFKQVRQRVAFRGLDDVRIRVFGGDRFQVGAVTGWITTRDEDDADFLEGTGDIDGGLVAGAYAAYTMGLFTFDVAYIEKLTGASAGPQYRFGVETNRPISDRGNILVRAGTTFASAEFMDTYFGVTPKQSRNSRAGIPVYTPDGGIKDVFIELGGSYDISERWVFKGGVRYGRLLDQAADSPLVETPDQVSGVVGLAYRFYLSP
ncbi:MAG: MipA/OmpV family protein [Methyloceanibacter sp.]|nr:MipA/OmpV family protein [Methyloceanibacter sp.]